MEAEAVVGWKPAYWDTVGQEWSHPERGIEEGAAKSTTSLVGVAIGSRCADPHVTRGGTLFGTLRLGRQGNGQGIGSNSR